MKLFAAHALLPGGWATDVLLETDAAGMLVAVTADAGADGAVRAAGPVVAGMPNLHSHAFQRALAGRTGARGGAGDSFWTWRQAMYAFLDRVDADAFQAIATQAYVEMLRAGYTAVAEFHYVHHDPAGRPYADPAELAWRIVAAARDAGIALTLLPVFYAHAGFGGAPPLPGQRRFVHTVDGYLRLQARVAAAARDGGFVAGAAPHSLRAATAGELAAVVAGCPVGAPLHIHAAEQAQEVEACIAATGLAPVAWLVERAGVDDRWCVVHATHVTADELEALARRGVTVGLAPTTEADLGDGTFPAAAFVARGGSFGIGSDSNTQIDPFAELRQLEWSQRLALGRRNVLGAGAGTVGAALWSAAAHGGARALAQPVGALAAGSRADLVVLDTRDAALAEQRIDDVLDAAIFGPARRPVRDVLVAGRWVVRDGRHLRDDDALDGFRRALRAVAQRG
ncbi:MAG: formimidoylglutamate deiminase [Betaproteobacteria bacterium]|nr:formimidoylglutamate deiminase [Betaproteobacteria bacterium]